MKKKLAAGVAVGLMLAGLSGEAGATLTTIGTAGYDSNSDGTIDATENYNLIWDDDNNGNSVVWLDYTNNAAHWSSQNTWAAGLGSALTMNLSAGYSVDFGANAWRLPTTVDGAWEYGVTGTTTAGYNITNSEMGHLFYTELGNKGYYDTSGNTQSDYGLTSVGDFKNLSASWYWSGTEYAADPFRAWLFAVNIGRQGIDREDSNGYGLAVRSGQVTYSDPGGGPGAPVPEPATMLLLGTGLAGLAGGRWKKARQGRIA